MNLAPLYRIKDEAVKTELADYIKHPERINDAAIRKIETWCTENNWGTKFSGKYKISMEKTPAELQPVAARYEPLQILMDETSYFMEASGLHRELEQFAWKMLKSGQSAVLALNVLFYSGKKDKTVEEDYGSISIAFESKKLIDNGLPAISEKFVFEVNRHLLEIEVQKSNEGTEDSVDAFGIPFQAIEEPMPSVKLAGGFDATIRTMFKEQRCQSRYGRIENAGYPISPSMRMQLQSALEWAGSAAQKNITWIKTDQNEILLAYPLSLPDVPISYTAMFKRCENKAVAFSAKAKQFIQELQQAKTAETDSKSKQIRIFVLRKIDKARTKVIYSRRTDANELEKCSEAWAYGCANLPAFPFGAPQVPYPLDAADILNRFWKQNGEIVTDKFKPFSKHHGLELLMESNRGRERAQIKKEMGKDPSQFTDSEFVRKYWDARIFGNTFLEDGGDKGFIKTGVVQFGMGVSIAPVEIIRQTNTNKAGVQEGKNAGMAPLAYRIAEHGVYCMPFFVNPNYAGKSGCTADDIELLKLLIPHAYEQNRSAVRPDVRIRHAWYIEHKNILGSCPEYLLFEALTPERRGNPTDPSSAWSDYEDKTALPPELLEHVASCVDLVKP